MEFLSNCLASECASFQFEGNTHVKALTALLEMGMVEGRLASSIRSRNCDEDEALVDREVHRLALALTARNWRSTKRPTVRRPSVSLRTSMPARCE